MSNTRTKRRTKTTAKRRVCKMVKVVKNIVSAIDMLLIKLVLSNYCSLPFILFLALDFREVIKTNMGLPTSPAYLAIGIPLQVLFLVYFVVANHCYGDDFDDYE